MPSFQTRTHLSCDCTNLFQSSDTIRTSSSSYNIKIKAQEAYNTSCEAVSARPQSKLEVELKSEMGYYVVTFNKKGRLAAELVSVK